jgi:hypothetical protein
MEVHLLLHTKVYIFCNILFSHRGGYEEFYFLGYNAV